MDRLQFEFALVGIDRAGRGRELAGPLRAIAPGAKYTLVHVVDSATSGIARTSVLDNERLGRMLEDERVRAGLPDADIELVWDQPVAAALARAATAAQLLVVGSPGSSTAARDATGVATDLLHRAPCPVLFVPPGCRDLGDRPHVIGVAFDGSTEALRALDVGVGIARTTGAALQICRALDPAPDTAWMGDALDEYAEALVATEDARLAELAASCAVPCHTEVAEGPTREVLASMARRCDVLICGSHGWGPSAREAFGSTVDRLMDHLRTPLLVVPKSVPGKPSTAQARLGRHARAARR